MSGPPSRTGQGCAKRRWRSPKAWTRWPTLRRLPNCGRPRTCCAGWTTETSRSWAAADSPHIQHLTDTGRKKAREKRALVITKANSRSTVHRSAYLDYIGIKSFDAAGNVNGERRFIGLFATTAYAASVRDIPVVREKVDAVLRDAGFPPDSHSGKDLLGILETYPRDELFQIEIPDLA